MRQSATRFSLAVPPTSIGTRGLRSRLQVMLLLAVTIAGMRLAPAALAQLPSFGDCEDAVILPGKQCLDMTDCLTVPTACAFDPDVNTYIEWLLTKKSGDCGGVFDRYEWSCQNCHPYWCVEGKAYSGMVAGHCNGFLYDMVWGFEDACKTSIAMV